MAQEEANKAILTKLYRDWHETRGGSVAALMSVFADDVNFGSLAEGVAPATFTARRIGKEQLKGYFDGLISDWTMEYYKVDHMIAEDDRVAVICSTSWTHKPPASRWKQRRSISGNSKTVRSWRSTNTTTPQN